MENIKGKRAFLVVMLVLWLFFHLILLFYGFTDEGDEEKFWPLSKRVSSYSLASAYDFSEFIVYTIGPFVLNFIIQTIRKSVNQGK